MLHPPGTILFHFYEVLAIIGQGGMGAVYKARDLRSDHIVAIKQMRPDSPSGFMPAELKERFEKEWTGLHSLDHARIPRMMASFSQGDSGYYVMEFVAGKSLDQVLDDYRARQEPFPEVLMLRYALQILEVLVYLHGLPKPLIHRDIKPQNIIVRDGMDELVLVDFGLARTSGSANTKTMVGTLGYCPLEQVKGHPEPRSDLYALGATMFHMLSGEPPAPFDISPLKQLRPNIHPGIAEIVDRAVESKKEKRYGSALKMEMAVRTLLAQLTGDNDERLAQLYMEQEPYRDRLPASNQPMPTWVFFGTLSAVVSMVLVLLLGVSHLRQAWSESSRTAATPTPSPVEFAHPDGQRPFVPPPPVQAAVPVGPIRLLPAQPAQIRLAADFFPAPFALRGIAGILQSNGTLESPAGQPAGLWFQAPQPYRPGLLRFQLMRPHGASDIQLQLVSQAQKTTLGLASTYEPAQHRYVNGIALMQEGRPTLTADQAIVAPAESFEPFSWFTLRFNPQDTVLEIDGQDQTCSVPAALPAVDVIRILIVGDPARTQSIRLQNVSVPR